MARAGPPFLRLPHVVVRVGARVVREAAPARGGRLLDLVRRDAGRAADRRDLGIVRRYDLQAEVTAEAELDRDGSAGIHRVERRLIVDRREETAERVPDGQRLVGLAVPRVVDGEERE